MSAPLISVDLTRPEDVTERHHRKFLNAALRAAATVHMLQAGPRHFERNKETAIGGPYGVTPRTKKHMLRKARQMGHQTPNVFTGRERAHVLANARVTATYQKSRVVYRSLHSRDAEQAERWIREMEAISTDEAAAASKHAGDVYAEQLADFRATRQRKRISN